jgi:3-oxoacyl-[acyl-carrier-protein] synthase-1
MSARPIALLNAGLVTPVGFSAPAACAAIRAKISHPTETRYIDASGEMITAHQVLMERPWRGLAKLVRMAALAIDECLALVPPDRRTGLPMLLCVADRERPGRLSGLDDRLWSAIEEEIGTTFGPQSASIAGGRVGVPLALSQVRTLIYERGEPLALIVAVDSLIGRSTLAAYEQEDRLLTPDNSNGFMPGEGASALLVGRPTGRRELVCTGLGFGTERAHIGSGEPLRADGLTAAHKTALAEAGVTMDDVDYRVADLSGEQYYFKEASLAYSRLLRTRSDNPELWHPAECTGAAGAALAGICLAVARAAVEKHYAPGPTVLLHFSDDNGQRASIVGRTD